MASAADLACLSQLTRLQIEHPLSPTEDYAVLSKAVSSLNTEKLERMVVTLDYVCAEQGLSVDQDLEAVINLSKRLRDVLRSIGRFLARQPFHASRESSVAFELRVYWTNEQHTVAIPQSRSEIMWRQLVLECMPRLDSQGIRIDCTMHIVRV